MLFIESVWNNLKIKKTMLTMASNVRSSIQLGTFVSSPSTSFAILSSRAKVETRLNLVLTY